MSEETKDLSSSPNEEKEKSDEAQNCSMEHDGETISQNMSEEKIEQNTADSKIVSAGEKDEEAKKNVKTEKKDEDEKQQKKDEDKKKKEKKDEKDKKEDEKSDKDDDEEDDDDEDDEPQIGLLERPLVIEGGRKRERKAVERITFQSDEKPVDIKEGKGRALGDIPMIEYQLARHKGEDLKPFHRLLFNRVGKATEVKKNIRQFSGFPFSKSDPEYEKRVQMLKNIKFTISMIKGIMEVLDLPRGGNKTELIERLLEFCEKPKDAGKKIPSSKRKKKSNESHGKDKAKKSKKDNKGKDKKKKEAKKKMVSDEEDEEEKLSADEEGDDDEEKIDQESNKETSEEENEESKEESDEEEPPKKKAKSVDKGKATLPAKAQKAKKETKKVKKEVPNKKASPKRKAKKEESNTSPEDSDEEPRIKKKAKSAPTNEELKEVIKKMLDSANLEQVTMKTVLKNVNSKYPEFDLSDRKDFIKETVKKIIS